MIPMPDILADLLQRGSYLERRVRKSSPPPPVPNLIWALTTGWLFNPDRQSVAWPTNFIYAALSCILTKRSYRYLPPSQAS